MRRGEEGMVGMGMGRGGERRGGEGIELRTYEVHHAACASTGVAHEAFDHVLWHGFLR